MASGTTVRSSGTGSCATPYVATTSSSRHAVATPSSSPNAVATPPVERNAAGMQRQKKPDGGPSDRQQPRRRSSVSGFARRASIMGKESVLEAQKAEMEMRIAAELQSVAGPDAAAQDGGDASPVASPTRAMDAAKTPEAKLRAAAAWGHAEALCELLFAGGVDVDAADDSAAYGWTAFHLACINGQCDAAEHLVRAGCDTARPIGVVEKSGVAYAQQLGQHAVVERLTRLAAEGCGGNLAKQLAALGTAGGTGSGPGERRTGVSAESTGSMQRGRDEADGGGPEGDSVAQAAVSTEKTAEQLARIRAPVGSNLLFSTLSDEARLEVFALVVEREFEARVDVITQGDDGDYFYIVDEGECEVIKDGEKLDAPPLRAGASFGELALMYSAPRAATVRTTEPTVCWALDRVAFRTTLFGGQSDQREQTKNFLAGVPLLQPLSSQERAKVADAVTVHKYSAGEDIVVAGEIGDAMFILQTGTAVALQPPSPSGEGEDGQTEEEELRTYSTPGDFFGELALLTNMPRLATVRAVAEEVVVLSLGRAAFTRLVGKCQKIIERSTQLHEQTQAQLAETQALTSSMRIEPPVTLTQSPDTAEYDF